MSYVHRRLGARVQDRPMSPAFGRAIKVGLLLGALLAGFALVSSAIRAVIFSADGFERETVVPDAGQVAEARADLIFVGPSHIQNGIDPDVFDAEMSKYLKVLSVNVAKGGSGLLETEFLLKKVFATDPCCVKYVVFYPALFFTNIARTSGTIRAIDYFSFPNAVRYLSYVTEFEPDPYQLPLTEYARNIVATVLQRYSNIGLGLKVIDLKPGRPPKANSVSPDPGFVAGPRGYFMLTTAMSDDEYKSWLREIDEYREQRPRFQQQIVSDRMFSAVADIIDFIGRHGARTIIVIPPAVEHWQWDLAFVRKYKAECPNGPPILDFDLETAPELYVRANFYNSSHLSGPGGKLWSRMLADEVGKLVKSGRLDEPSFCGRHRR